MAGERTEAATPRKLQTLRSEGRVVRSADLSAAIGVLGGVILLQQFGGGVIEQLRWFTVQRLSNMTTVDLTDTGLSDLARVSTLFFFKVMAPFLIAIPLIGVVTNVGQVGLLVSGKAITPDFSRINPISGMKRLFSVHSLVELIKTLVKLGIVAFVLYRVYMESLPALMTLSGVDLRAGGPLFAETALSLGMTVGSAFIVMAILDYGYQRWEFRRGARMSHEDLKEEYRQAEGSPQVRAQIRKRQRRMAQSRMMQNVPKADVVITNPTHFAVALVYSSGEMTAPKVVAKGADLIAQRIKLLASEHAVPVVENKALARALYRTVDLDQEIPTDLFQAVAEVLAYIYALKRKAGDRGQGTGVGAQGLGVEDRVLGAGGRESGAEWLR